MHCMHIKLILYVYSAQQMLRTCSLAELLVMDEPQLSVSFPWLPEKARTVRMFHIGLEILAVEKFYGCVSRMNYCSFISQSRFSQSKDMHTRAYYNKRLTRI